jgi:Sigma-70 region 2
VGIRGYLKTGGGLQRREGLMSRMANRRRDAVPDHPAGVGRDRSYAELYVEHVPAARRLALSMVPPDAADDVVAEAFARVLTAIRTGRGPRHASPGAGSPAGIGAAAGMSPVSALAPSMPPADAATGTISNALNGVAVAATDAVTGLAGTAGTTVSNLASTAGTTVTGAAGTAANTVNDVANAASARVTGAVRTVGS